MQKIGRPKVENKKINLSLSINNELDGILTNFLNDKDFTKSQYVEKLIKDDMRNRGISVKNDFEK
jgi:hypothetical protein